MRVKNKCHSCKICGAHHGTKVSAIDCCVDLDYEDLLLKKHQHIGKYCTHCKKIQGINYVGDGDGKKK